jgi:DHA2 family multidrug resistance protein
LGGVLVDHGLWRWIFFINIPIGAVAISLGSWLLRTDRTHTSVHPDPWGLVWSIVGFGAVLHASSIASDDGWGSPMTLTWFSVGALGLVVFTFVEWRRADRDPLLDLRLYTNPIFVNANLVGYVAVVALFGAEFLLPLYLQQLRQYDGWQTGVTLLPLAVVASFTAPLAGRLYDKIGPRAIAAFGYVVLSVNTYQLAQLSMTTLRLEIMILMALRGLALGCTVQTTNTTALGSVARERLQRGSALVQGTRYVMQSLGVAVLSTVLASASMTKQPTLPGFDAAYTITFYAALGALVLALFLPGWPGQWGGRESLRRGGAHDA